MSVQDSASYLRGKAATDASVSRMILNSSIDALFDQALQRHDAGQLAEALLLYDAIIGASPKNAVVFNNRGLALQGLARFEAAVASYEQAIALHPNYAEAYANRGDALQMLNRLREAVTSYDRALALNPDIAEIYLNRGGAHHKLGNFSAAVADYDRSIALSPASAESYANRGLTLMELGRVDDALADFKKVDRRSPVYAEAALNAFGLCLSELHNQPPIEEMAAEAERVVIAKTCDDLSREKCMLDFQVLHDLEQTCHLIESGYDTPGLRRLRERLERIYARRSPSSAQEINNRIALTNDEIADINAFRKTPLRYRGESFVGACLNPDNDWHALEEQYLASSPEIISIDNFLTPSALTELLRFCLISTAWRKAYDGQYLGAFAEGGFFSPLHRQIAHELRIRMPRIFSEHPLRQLWSFKCMAAKHRGLKVHADFARVNLNFWLTPDDANLDPTSGGMIVHDIAAPGDWSFKDYNNDEKGQEDRIYGFLRARGANRIKIPYRCNRAVLFNSNLFHETDQFHFKDGYENRRINVTYLFGNGLKTP